MNGQIPRFTEHVIRCEYNRLINNVFWNRLDGRIPVGWPRKRAKDGIIEDLEKMGMTQWKILAQDR